MSKQKAFLFYYDWKETFDELTDEEAGKLTKYIIKLVNDEKFIIEDKVLKMCFIPIRATIERDKEKHSAYIDKQRTNGAKGGRPKKTQKTQRLLKEPKKADSVNESETANVNKNVNKNVGVEGKTNHINTNAINYLKEADTIDAVIKNHKLKDIEDLQKHLKIFHKNLTNTGDTYKEYTDYKKHFNSWLTKYKKYETELTEKKNLVVTSQLGNWESGKLPRRR